MTPAKQGARSNAHRCSSCNLPQLISSAHKLECPWHPQHLTGRASAARHSPPAIPSSSSVAAPAGRLSIDRAFAAIASVRLRRRQVGVLLALLLLASCSGSPNAAIRVIPIIIALAMLPNLFAATDALCDHIEENNTALYGAGLYDVIVTLAAVCALVWVAVLP